jgi:hypothetical protein
MRATRRERLGGVEDPGGGFFRQPALLEAGNQPARLQIHNAATVDKLAV